jgi:uncharacterized lipoprotein YmbA
MFSLGLLVAGLIACSSSGPATSYYALIPSHSVPSELQISNLGLAPVVLPEYLDNIAVISRKDSVGITVSGRHAWAEPLDKGINRVLAADLSHYYGQAVVAFPWDQRDRPVRQLRVVFESFDGVRGGTLGLVASWSVYDYDTKSVQEKGRVRLQASSETSDYVDYVKTLNVLVDQLAASLADKVTLD